MRERTLCTHYAYKLAKHHDTIRLCTRLALPPMVMAIGVLLWGVFPEVWPWNGADWAEAWHRLWEKITHIGVWSLGHIALSAVSLIQIGYSHSMQKHERLILTRTGIAYHSPLPKPLQWFKPSWTLSWPDILSVELKPPKHVPNPMRATLVFNARTRKQRIMPFQWLDPTDDKPLGGWTLARVLRRHDPQWLRDTLLNTPVLQHLLAADIRVDVGAVTRQETDGFSLASNPHSLAAVLLFFALIAYAGTDWILIEETYAGRPFYTSHVGAGLVMAGISAMWLLRTKVPTVESVSVAMLLGTAVGIALYPGLLRINQLTDPAGLRAYAYILQEDLSLRPADPALPACRFDDISEYWQQFEVGSVHTLHVRKGGLGFYQVDMAPVYEHTRHYYQQQQSGQHQDPS
jgi:hypothetical protein